MFEIKNVWNLKIFKSLNLFKINRPRKPKTSLQNRRNRKNRIPKNPENTNQGNRRRTGPESSRTFPNPDINRRLTRPAGFGRFMQRVRIALVTGATTVK
jgi:hypothetical protein